MEINRINNIRTNANFKSAIKKTSATGFENPIKDESNKIKTGLLASALIGAVLAGAFALKNKNNKPIVGLKKKFFTKPEVDPVLKKLNGKRDAEAVKIYKGYKAQQKSLSLKRKVINGDFNGKPNKVYKYLIKNEQKLEREACAVM